MPQKFSHVLVSLFFHALNTFTKLTILTKDRSHWQKATCTQQKCHTFGDGNKFEPFWLQIGSLAPSPSPWKSVATSTRHGNVDHVDPNSGGDTKRQKTLEWETLCGICPFGDSFLSYKCDQGGFIYIYIYIIFTPLIDRCVQLNYYDHLLDSYNILVGPF